MKNKLLILALAAATMMAGCKKYDDTDVRNDIQNLQNRVTALEQWCETAKGQISSLQGLVQALESKNFITGVTPVMEGTQEVGYTITFQTGNPITIKHGKDGEPGVTPQIGVAKDEANPADENYYWTVKIGEDEPEFILDGENNKIAVTGKEGEPGHTPVLSVEEEDGVLYWKVDGEWLLSDGKPVPATGEKGEPGDAIFQKNGCILDDPTCVTFVLADGTRLTLPRANTLTVGFDSYEVFMLTPTTSVIDIVLPETLKEEDYTALVAEIKNEAGTGMDIATRAASSPWQVELTEPTFVDGKYQNDAKATVTAAGANNGDRAILKITLIDSKGQEISASRVLEYFDGTVVRIVQEGGLGSALADAVPAGITDLKILGTPGVDDFAYIRENLTALEVLDLSGTDLTVFPDRALAFYDDANTTLKEVTLPEGLTSIEDAAFANCTALTRLDVPATVTELGRWILENTKVSSFTIPEGVAEIPASCFYGTDITSIVVPASVTSIGDWAFEGSDRLQSVVIEGDVTEIPEGCFIYISSLTSVTIPASVQKIGADAFNQCKIASLTLPASLEVIGARAFSNNGITQLTIPDKVTTIANAAFNSNNIAVIDLPASIASIHATAFNWKSATTVICRAATVPQTPQTDEFNNSWPPFYQVNKESCVLKVPAESLSEYQTAWGSYFDHIEAITD